MERLHFTMQLRDGAVEEYERRHQQVWPALQADLYSAGWRNYSLFRRGLTVHGYAECHPDVDAAQRGMSSSEANAEWQAWFSDVIEEIVDDEGHLITARQLWHMDEELAAATSESRNDPVTRS